MVDEEWLASSRGRGRLQSAEHGTRCYDRVLDGGQPAIRRFFVVRSIALRKDISLIAATIYGNRGAEAMLCSVIGVTRQRAPDTHFHVFSYYPEDDRARVSAKHVTIHSATPLAVALKLFPLGVFFGLLRLVLGRSVFRFAPQSIRALAGSAFLVDLAGVSFIDGREKFLPYNVLTLLPALLLGTPVVKMPQALGPFRGTLNRIAASLVLPLCSKVWARGEGTLANLQASGIAGLKFERGNDVAFNFQASYSLSNECPASYEKNMERLTELRGPRRGVIGLCPSSVVAVTAAKTGVPYEPIMAELVASLVADGFLVVLFPNATRDESGEKQRNNDLPLMRRIRDAAIALNTSIEGSIVSFDMDINTASIKRVIDQVDVALVSRFHAMIGALSQAVPVTVLGWSHKYAEVMALFGLESLVLDYTKSSVGALRDKIAETFEGRSAIQDAIRAALPDVITAAVRPIESLLDERNPSE